MNEAAVITRRTASPTERRTAPRHNVAMPTKVYDDHAEKFFSGRTGNISESGALILVQRSIPTFVGETLDVAIAQSSEESFVRRDDMISSTVVRVMPVDHFTQAIAVRFSQPAALDQDIIDEMHPSPQAAA